MVKKKGVWRKIVQINTSGIDPEYETSGVPHANTLTNRQWC